MLAWSVQQTRPVENQSGADKYGVDLPIEKREPLQALTRQGTPGGRPFRRAVALPFADAGDGDAVIAVKAGRHSVRVERVRKRCVEENVLDLYEAPSDFHRPVVCIDEPSHQSAVQRRSGGRASSARSEASTVRRTTWLGN